MIAAAATLLTLSLAAGADVDEDIVVALDAVDGVAVPGWWRTAVEETWSEALASQRGLKVLPAPLFSARVQRFELDCPSDAGCVARAAEAGQAAWLVRATLTPTELRAVVVELTTMRAVRTETRALTPGADALAVVIELAQALWPSRSAPAAVPATALAASSRRPLPPAAFFTSGGLFVGATVGAAVTSYLAADALRAADAAEEPIASAVELSRRAQDLSLLANVAIATSVVAASASVALLPFTEWRADDEI